MTHCTDFKLICADYAYKSNKSLFLPAELFIDAFTVSMKRNLPSISTSNPVANVTKAFA